MSQGRYFSAADSYAQLYDNAASSSTPIESHTGDEKADRSTRSANTALTAGSGQDRGAGATPGTGGDDEDDDDDDDDDDWDVYNDFNNQTSASPVTSHNYDTEAGQKGIDEPSGHQTTPYRYTDSALKHVSPGQQRNSTLLDPSSFGFDVQNADPRRSTFIPASMHFEKESRDRSMDSRAPLTTPTYDKLNGTTEEGDIELITVPGLGNEFTNAEKVHMTRKYKQKAKRGRRKEAAKKWGKGDYKIWGWLSPRAAVFISFGSLVCLGILLYFVIPRVPSLSFNSTTPLIAQPDPSGMSTHYAPTNWSMTMDLALRSDNSAGWIPSYVSKMEAVVTEVTTLKRIGRGSLAGISLPGRRKKSFTLPVQFAYTSLNASGDATFLAVYQACQHKSPGTTRPNLNLGVEITMYVRGLIGAKSSSTRINTPCPFELAWE